MKYISHGKTTTEGAPSVNRLEQVESLDGAGGSGRGKGDVSASAKEQTEHMGGNTSVDAFMMNNADCGGGQEQELRPLAI